MNCETTQNDDRLRRCCATCRWWTFPNSVCVSVMSPYLGDYTLGQEVCQAWEPMNK